MRLDPAPFEHRLRVAYRAGGGWRPLPLLGDRERGYVGRDAAVEARLRIEPRGDHFAFELTFTAEEPTRLQLALLIPAVPQAEIFHLIPGVIFGDNNLAHAEPGHFPNLTREHAGDVSCSPYWELRADRASHPVSMMCFGDGGAGLCVAAVSIDPYSESRPLAPPGRDGFIRNGVFAQLAHETPIAGDAPLAAPEPAGCGVTLGYGNLPRTFLNKDQWLLVTAHFATRGRAGGLIFLLRGASRLDAHRVIRGVYERHHEPPATPISARDAAAALTRAFLDINWHDADGTTAAMRAEQEKRATAGRGAMPAGATASAFFGGGGFREQFTNMRCGDEARRMLRAWRTLAEVGWTGGGVIGYPLLIAGHALGEPTAVERARYVLDQVAQAYNPASGLLWDVAGKHEGRRLNWWWSGYLVKDCHCAYTNGTAVCYLLKAAEHLRGLFGEAPRPWVETGLKVLDTMLRLQEPSGNFGFTYSAERPEMLDREGFAGCWFVPAMCYAYRASGDGRYLNAAHRGAEHYHGFVRELACWGAPMDTWKAVDQEGNLAFLRGARLLHEITREERYLEMLAQSAEYEYLWRYGFAARPEHPPLKGSHFSSVGGSITSVSNPHIHPMGVYVSADLHYLARNLGGADGRYHARRCEDGLDWARNIVALYPDAAGYGAPGVLSERYCPSDGLTIETYPDGSPSSLWFSYNGWAAAAVLEGLVETMG